MTTMRILHLFVIVALVVAAAYVYDIKFEATMQAERLSKLRGEIRRERDAVAALRAEWAKLTAPERIQDIAQRHLPLRPLDQYQIDNLAALPERPRPAQPELLQPEPADPIAALLGATDPATTGSVPAGSDR
jgi:cell division protein FtsL